MLQVEARKSQNACLLLTEPGVAHVRTFFLPQGDRKEFVMYSVGFGKQRPGKPEDCGSRRLQEAITWCWKEDPRERKTADELLGILGLA